MDNKWTSPHHTTRIFAKKETGKKKSLYRVTMFQTTNWDLNAVQMMEKGCPVMK